MSDEIPETWIADTVTYLLEGEALARFHAAGARHGLSPAQMRVKIATAPGLPQYLQMMLAEKYSERYEIEKEPNLNEPYRSVPGLTPYDTGQRAEPKVWESRHRESDNDYGKVDFNAEDDATIATLYIERDKDGTYAIRGYTSEPLKIEIKEE
jgi:hypothetical protein